MAGRFLPGIFETKAKAAPADAPIRAGGSALASAGMPLGDAGQWDMGKAVRDGYERVSAVFRSVDAIATTQARLPIARVKVDPKKARGDFEIVDDPMIWRLLNFRANSYETSYAFRYRLSSTLLLSRRGAFVEMVPGKGGEIESIHLLAPGQVKPVPDPKTFVSSYQIMRGDSVIDEVDPANVVWIKIKPHPMDPYSQMTPLVAAGLSMETDFLARMFNRNFLMNDGRPGMVIAVKGQLSQGDADELKARYSGGGSQAGVTSVIEADGMDIADMAVNPRDMQWTEMIAGNKLEIQMAFGTPESVLGNASGRTFDNADAERENYYIDTVQPHCDPIAMALDRLTGDENDDQVLTFDYSGVDVLQRMAARKREEKRGEFDKGLITVDEYRESAGYGAFNVAGTRVLINAKGFAIPKDDSDQEGVDKLKMIAGGGGAAPDPEAAAQAGAQRGAEMGAAEADRQRGNTNAAMAVRARAMELARKNGIDLETKDGKKKRKRPANRTRPNNVSGGILRDRTHHPYMGLRYKMEGFIEGQLTQWDYRQEDVVAERLHHAKFRKGTRHWTETKALPDSQKCKYCKEQATKRIIHAEGRAYIPVCDDHLAKGKEAAYTSTPDGTRDVTNLDRVDEIKSGQVLEYTPLEVKKVVPKYAVSEDEWVAEIVKSMGTFLRKAMLREARNAAKNMKNDKVDKYTNLELSGRDPLKSLFGGEDGIDKKLDPIIGAVLDIVRNSAKAQTVKLAKTIETMDNSGATIRQMEAEVRKQTSTRAPWRKNLAVAVTTAAVEGARNAVYETAPDIYVKQWNSQHDERTRPTHVKADNQQQEPKKPFKVGEAKLMFPCDPAGPIHETANCRCYTTMELSDKYWDMVEAAFDAGDDDA